jgi:hypothetical protein
LASALFQAYSLAKPQFQKVTLLLLSQDKASHLNIENQAKHCASPKMLAKGANAILFGLTISAQKSANNLDCHVTKADLSMIKEQEIFSE